MHSIVLMFARSGGAGPAFFCTPNLTTVECYANGNEDTSSQQTQSATTIDGHTLFFALQCRVRPSAIIRPDRHFARNNDEEVMGLEGVFEWMVNDPKDIRPYAVLVRDKAGSDHRALATLISEGKWNRDHLPLKFGSFDHIPGRKAPHGQIQKSYLAAQAALVNVREPVGCAPPYACGNIVS